MVYSQIRTLISLLIVLGLGVGFLWGGSRLLDRVTGAAPPPTPTVQPAVEQPAVPTTPPAKRPTRTPRGRGSVAPRPTTPAPRPSPTPKAPPQVIITASLAPTNPATVFHAGQSPQLTCWVRNDALPPGAVSLTFNWVEDAPLANHFLYQYPLARSGQPYTGAWYQYVAQNPGKYHCDVIVNGQVFSSAHFTVLP